MLAKKHSVAIMSAENQLFKRLGLHYNVIFTAGDENESLRQRNLNHNPLIEVSVTNFG
jgi:hypothetical protein